MPVNEQGCPWARFTPLLAQSCGVKWHYEGMCGGGNGPRACSQVI
jgi:hypothetical protein